MVDYERGLSDLGFRHTKERKLGRRLGQGDCPKSAARVCPRAAAAAGGPAARARVLGCNTLRIDPMQVSALPAKTRIETIQRCPPGTFVRVENEVITLHNSPRWNPRNRYIQQRLKESRIQIYNTKIQITFKTI